jgi:hypothetical protein
MIEISCPKKTPTGFTKLCQKKAITTCPANKQRGKGPLFFPSSEKIKPKNKKLKQKLRGEESNVPIKKSIKKVIKKALNQESLGKINFRILSRQILFMAQNPGRKKGIIKRMSETFLKIGLINIKTEVR